MLLTTIAWLVANFPQTGFWYDEALTTFVATDSWGTLWAWCTQIDIQVPLHYVVLRLWSGVFGSSEFALRLVSVFSILLAVAAIISIGRRLSKYGLGYAAGALLAFMPGLLWIAYEVRAYAFGLALYAWATRFLVAIIVPADPPEIAGNRLFPHRYVLAYALLMLGALYTHYTALGAVAAQVVLLALLTFIRRSRPLLRTTITIAILIGIGFAPWLPIMLTRSGEDRSYYRGSIPPDRSTAVMLGFHLMGRDDVPDEFPALVIAYAVLLLAAVIIGLRWREMRLATLVGLFSVLGPVIITAVLVFFRPKLSGRYAWPAWIGVDLLFGVLVIAIARFRREIGIVGLVALLAVPTFIGERGHPPRSGYREAFAYICENGTKDDVILLRDGTLFVTAEYYLKRPPCDGMRYTVGMPMYLITNVDGVLRYEDAVNAVTDVIARRPPNVWIVAWQGDVMDPQTVTYAVLDLNRHSLVGKMFGDVRLDRYEQPTEIVQPFRGDVIIPEPDGPEMLGVKLIVRDDMTNGDVIVLHAWWKRGVKLDDMVRVSAQLTSADGGWTYAQVDQPPGGWKYFDDRWLPDEPVLGRYELPIGPDVPKGDVAVRYIIYDAAGRWKPIQIPMGTVRVH